jgi:hypothetical protein
LCVADYGEIAMLIAARWRCRTIAVQEKKKKKKKIQMGTAAQRPTLKNFAGGGKMSFCPPV